MRRGIIGSILVLTALSLAFVPQAGAQGFQTKTWYAGPRVWIGNLNDAVAVGGQIERGFTNPGEFGSGVISGGVGLDYYSWSYSYPTFGQYKYSVIPVQFFANYHFPVRTNPRLDPYAGLGIVYSHVSASWNGSVYTSPYVASASSTDLAGDIGLRYFVNPSFALQGQLGFGYGTLGLGVNWQF